MIWFLVSSITLQWKRGPCWGYRRFPGDLTALLSVVSLGFLLYKGLGLSGTLDLVRAAATDTIQFWKWKAIWTDRKSQLYVLCNNCSMPLSWLKVKDKKKLLSILILKPGAKQAFVLVFVSVKGVKVEQEKYQPKTKNRLCWQIFQAYVVSLRNLRCLVWFEREKLLQWVVWRFLYVSFF